MKMMITIDKKKKRQTNRQTDRKKKKTQIKTRNTAYKLQKIYK